MQFTFSFPRGILALVASLAVAFGAAAPWANGQPEQLPASDQTAGVEPLTRGPIHEAFGQPIDFNPQPGLLVTKAPPDPINEIPPDQKPAGENVVWIPGYWGWDPSREDFVWVSGFWRNMPPGREWIPGYWKQAENGYQWVSGYWADAAQQDTQYLPQPPESLDVGPSTEAPAPDYIWSPGYWDWETNRYFWRPGYWLAPQADWVWVAPHYCWSPSGYIFVNGFWDFPPDTRGLLFCPTYFAPAVYGQPGFYFTPTVFLDTNALVDNLFCWPRYYHYCFGDFYGGGFGGLGIYPWFSFHNRYGWDPLFAHYRSAYGARDPRWVDKLAANYRFRQEHAAARPPVTFRDQQRLVASGRLQGNQLALAKPLRDGLTSVGRLPLDRVGGENRLAAVQRGRSLRQLQDQRRQTEARRLGNRPSGAAANVQPQRMPRPQSPVRSMGEAAANVPALPRQEPTRGTIRTYPPTRSFPGAERGERTLVQPGTAPPAALGQANRPPAAAPRENVRRLPPEPPARSELALPERVPPRVEQQLPHVSPRSEAPVRSMPERPRESRLQLPPAMRIPSEPRIMTQRTPTPYTERRPVQTTPHVTGGWPVNRNVGPVVDGDGHAVHQLNYRHR